MRILNEDSPKRSLRAVRVGRNVKIFDFVNAYECSIGDETKIGAFVEIQRNVRIGKNCKISSHAFLCEGVTIKNGVFVGHGVIFINDRFPRATNAKHQMKNARDWRIERTQVGEGASIGSGATIMCGVRVGKGALVGAGSVVTKNVKSFSVVVGNPAVEIRTLKKSEVGR